MRNIVVNIWKNLIMNKGKKFDIILANPPYDKTLHEKFLEKFLYIAETIVSVQPLTWLTNQKQRKKITELIDQLYTDIETITPGAFFDATIAQDMAIHYITNTKKHQLKKYRHYVRKLEKLALQKQLLHQKFVSEW